MRRYPGRWRLASWRVKCYGRQLLLFFVRASTCLAKSILQSASGALLIEGQGEKPDLELSETRVESDSLSPYRVSSMTEGNSRLERLVGLGFLPRYVHAATTRVSRLWGVSFSQFLPSWATYL